MTDLLQPVYPLYSTLNEAGHLIIDGCDVLELAQEFGTPAYIYAERDIETRVDQYRKAFEKSGHPFEILYASKACATVALNTLLSQNGLSCDVASSGELLFALAGGFPPEKIWMHGNNKTQADLQLALDHHIGHIIVDSFQEISRLSRLVDEHPSVPFQKILLRVTPNIQPDTHLAISTGQADSKFGFQLDELASALSLIKKKPQLQLRGLHAHIGSQIFDLAPFERISEVLQTIGSYPLLNLGGGLGIAYSFDDQPATPQEYVQALTRHVPADTTILCEPGRSIVGNAGITLYTIGTTKHIPTIRNIIAVDGGMSDNLRPMLYNATYHADIASRFPEARSQSMDSYTVVGMHCESGDVLIKSVGLMEPQVGDILAVPATGAYGHSMSNNYNALLRPPVIFCREGNARAVVRRETYDDLFRRETYAGEEPIIGGGGL